MKRKKKIIIAIVLGVVAAALGLAIALGSSKSGNPVMVERSAVRQGLLEENVSASGSFASQLGRTLVAELSSSVEQIAVHLGDRVQAGQLLVQLQDRDAREDLDRQTIALEKARQDLAQKLASLRLNYRQAALTLTQARKAVAANEELLKLQAVTSQALEKSRDDLVTAELNLQTSRDQLNLACNRPAAAEPLLDAVRDAELVEAHPEIRQAVLTVASAQRRLDSCSLRSPFKGTVTQLTVQYGDRVNPGQALVKVEDLDRIQAEINIDEVDIGKIKTGDSASIKSDSIIGTELKGTVASIAPVIQSMGNSRVSAVKVELEPGPARLLPGASCTVHILSRIKEQVLIIPLVALIPGSVPDAVWLLQKTAGKDGKEVETVTRREIQAGISTISEIEVKGGLAVGDEVVASNAGMLAEGMAVMVNRSAPVIGKANLP